MIQILIVGEIMSKFFFKIKIFFKKINSFLSKGQIGDGKSGINILFPVAVSNTGVLSGGPHTCVITNDLKAYCWIYIRKYFYFLKKKLKKN
jgi:hypothetical protein